MCRLEREPHSGTATNGTNSCWEISQDLYVGGDVFAVGGVGSAEAKLGGVVTKARFARGRNAQCLAVVTVNGVWNKEML